LAATIEAAQHAAVIKVSSVTRMIVDTTVIPKAIAHPADSRLLARCREHLVKAATRPGSDRTTTARHRAWRCRLAATRMRHALRTLRSRAGRVMRDVERQVDQASRLGRSALLELIARTKRILSQKPKNKNKLYAMHAPEVECLAKGKLRMPYECSVKMSITTT
jgi:IS5 family transposase